MEKKFVKDYTIGYFETDGQLILEPSFLVAYLQDMAISHSDALGYTLDYLAEQKKGWAVLNWHISIGRMPSCGETIRLWTWAEKCRRMQAQRSFYVFDEKGKIIIRVASRWVFIDLERRRPTSIGQDMEEKYGNSLVSAIENETYTLPKEQAEDTFLFREFTVTRRDTDNNGHANNIKYIEWAMDDVPDEIYDSMIVHDLKVVYRKECYKGTLVQSKCCVRELTEGGKEVISFFIDALDKKTIFAQVVSQWKKSE